MYIQHDKIYGSRTSGAKRVRAKFY